MREIRFRAWDDSISKMIDWDELSKRSMDGHSYYGLDLILKGESHHYHVMQYTGLRDKAGKGIYESDIVRVLYTDWPSKSPDDPRTLEQYQIDISKVGQIVFEGYEWCVKMRGKYGDNFDTFIVGRHGWMEVIGNIWETPELLKP